MFKPPHQLVELFFKIIHEPNPTCRKLLNHIMHLYAKNGKQFVQKTIQHSTAITVSACGKQESL